MPDLIALYGTLMSGFAPRPGAPALRSHIELVSPCVLAGVLYDCGSYPGLSSGQGEVLGELWHCISADALEILDEWEGYDPERMGTSEYVRRRVRLLEPDCEAWVYHWNLATDELKRITGGDWRSHTGSQQHPMGG